jgi:hypothetical protein
MPTTPFRPRFSWITLAAFVGAVLTAGEASACQAMPDAGACPPACGCCQAAEPAMPVPDDAVPATAGTLLAPGGEHCRPAPAGGCACRSEAPTAPEPTVKRSDESRPDPSRDVAVGWPGLAGISRASIDPVLPTISPPQKSPLYLRISRLLI